MFGPHASLNLSGAFTVSTADYVKFAGGGIFQSSLGNANELSGAAATAFGFVNSTPAPVGFLGSQLTGPAGNGLNVIAGNITLDSPTGDTTTAGAALKAPGGGLTLFSAGSAGEVPFSFAAPGSRYASASVTSFGTVSLGDKSTIAIDSQQGGGARAQLLHILDVATDVYVWKLLRRDQALNRSAAEAIVCRMINSVTKTEGADGKDPLAQLVGRRQPAS